MELRFETHKLNDALRIVGSAAARNHILPVAANILIRTIDERIQLAATNLEVGMKMFVEGKVTESGSTTVPAAKLADIVSACSHEQVRLTTLKNDRVRIDSGAAQFKLQGLSDEEFPPLPDIGGEFFTLNSRVLCDMMQKTAFAVSTEETRHFLNGVYLSITSDTVQMVATDGKRISVVTHQHTGPVEQEISAIVPAKAVSNILRTFKGDEDVKVAVMDNQIVFAAQGMTLISRLIEGEYPDWEAVMMPTKSNAIALTVNREQLLAVMKRVSLVANPKTPSVRMEFKEHGLRVSASSPELGEAEEQMEVKTEGDMEIAFNARFVMDILRNIDEDEVLFKFRDPLSPALVTPLLSNGYMCVIMPSRL